MTQETSPWTFSERTSSKKVDAFRRHISSKITFAKSVIHTTRRGIRSISGGGRCASMCPPYFGNLAFDASVGKIFGVRVSDTLVSLRLVERSVASVRHRPMPSTL